MARRRSTAKVLSKSDAIRGILKQQPRATTDEIKSALQKRGIEASDALVNKIKYGRRAGKGGRKSSKRTSRKSPTSKAEAIRGAWSKLGTGARPRDVIAVLARRGVTVSSAQVSALRNSARVNRKSEISSTTSVSLEHLVAAKNLANRLGGIDVARTALANLARLIES